MVSRRERDVLQRRRLLPLGAFIRGKFQQVTENVLSDDGTQPVSAKSLGLRTANYGIYRRARWRMQMYERCLSARGILWRY